MMQPTMWLCSVCRSSDLVKNLECFGRGLSVDKVAVLPYVECVGVQVQRCQMLTVPLIQRICCFLFLLLTSFSEPFLPITRLKGIH